MRKNKPLALGMSLGIAFGAIIGWITDNTGLWMGVGIALGAVIGARYNKRKKDI